MQKSLMRLNAYQVLLMLSEPFVGDMKVLAIFEAAIAFTLCELRTSHHQTFPMECASFVPDPDSKPLPLERASLYKTHSICVEALKSSVQYWTSYHGNLQRVVQQCHAYRRLHDRDEARDILHRTTVEHSRLQQHFTTTFDSALKALHNVLVTFAAQQDARASSDEVREMMLAKNQREWEDARMQDWNHLYDLFSEQQTAQRHAWENAVGVGADKFEQVSLTFAQSKTRAQCFTGHPCRCSCHSRLNIIIGGRLTRTYHSRNRRAGLSRPCCRSRLSTSYGRPQILTAAHGLGAFGAHSRPK